MATIIADRVRERSTSTGTGAFALAGAATGFRSFSNVCAVNDGFYAVIVAVDANSIPTGQWEVGYYTYSALNTLTRTVVTASSSNGARVNFGPGQKDIFIDITAHQVKNFNQVVLPPGTVVVPPPAPDPTPAPTGAGTTTGGAPSGLTYMSVPAITANDQTVPLARNTVYVGTLELSGRSNVHITAASGTGQKPIVSPGALVTGWTQHSGNIYRAPFSSFAVSQVNVNNKAANYAHWPSRATRWLIASGYTDTSISYSGLPSTDLSGARACVRIHNSGIRERGISSADGGAIYLNQGIGETWHATDGLGRAFYLENKLWMLAAAGDPNTFFHDGSTLYLWCEDGQSPAGKTVWVTSDNICVNAANTTNCSVTNLYLIGGRTGVNLENATNGLVQDTYFANQTSYDHWLGGHVFFGGTTGTTIRRCTGLDGYREGFQGWYGTHGVTFSSNYIANTGLVGMPKNTHGFMHIGSQSNEGRTSSNLVNDNVATNSCYHGLQVTRNYNCTVRNNNVSYTCMGVTDGGAIYTGFGVPPAQNMNMIIEDNIVYGGYRSGGPNHSFGIYLDDSSRDVVVRNNRVYNFDRTLFLHGAHDCVITGNHFECDARAGDNRTWNLIGMASSRGTITRNVITNNTLVQRNDTSHFYNLEPRDLQAMAHINGNVYETTNTSTGNFARTWDGVSGENRSLASWRSYMGTFTSQTYWTGSRNADGSRVMATINSAGTDSASSIASPPRAKDQYSDLV